MTSTEDESSFEDNVGQDTSVAIILDFGAIASMLQWFCIDYDSLISANNRF